MSTFEERTEELYQTAVRMSMSEDYNELDNARSLFESFIDYKLSKDYLEIVKKKLTYVEDPINKVITKKRTFVGFLSKVSKPLLIIILIIVAVLSVGLSIKFVNINIKYYHAIRLAENGKTDEALSDFSEMMEFRKSYKYYMEIIGMEYAYEAPQLVALNGGTVTYNYYLDGEVFDSFTIDEESIQKYKMPDDEYQEAVRNAPANAMILQYHLATDAYKEKIGTSTYTIDAYVVEMDLDDFSGTVNVVFHIIEKDD